MQIIPKMINRESKKSIQLLMLLVVSEILSTQAYTLIADDLRAHPGTIVFNAVQGQSFNDTRSIFIFSSLGGILNWSQSANVSWLTRNLTNGVTSTDTILKVGVNIAGMSAGIYNGTITLYSPQSGAGPVIISVTLIVNPDVPVKVTTWKDGHSGAMSVSVDDSRASGFDALQANGLKGTYFLGGDVPPYIPSFSTTYYNAGMELGCHLNNHLCYSVSDNILRSREIMPNISGIVTYTPEPANALISMAWPCGFTSFREQAIATEYFLGSRGYNINQLESATPDNFMNLKSYNSHEHPPYPPSDFKTLVDAAVNQKKWFNLVLHDYTNDDGAINYTPSKDIWVSSIGTVIKYILQRDRFILTNYIANYDRITYNVSRLQLPSSVYRSFENAFDPNDQITMQIDVDDTKTIEDVLVNGVSNPFQTKNLSGNIVLLTNVKLESASVKTIVVQYHITTIGLTISGVTANNKVYNGTTLATLNTGGATLIGIVPGDVVTLISDGATGTFINPNAGSAKAVSTSGFILGGTDASKYFLTPPTTSADITPLAITVSGVTANDKVYNGTTSATLNTGSAALVDVLPGDIVTPVFSGATGTFVNKNTGTAKLVTISGITLGGSSAGNYYIITQPTTSANITPLALTVSGVTASNKIYDGTTTVTLNTGGALLVGVVPGDVVTMDPTYATGIFVNKNAGTAKSVTVSGITIGGAGAGNYTITQPTTSANITPLALTVSGVTANNKVYNGTTSATLNTGGAILSGVLPGDIVTPVFTAATGTFVNKNVGTGKSVAMSGITLDGSSAGNYTLTQPSSAADITTAQLTISGVTVYNKVYDGTYTATLNTGSAVLTGVFGTDAVVLIKTGATGTFASANAGTAIVVSTSGFALGGTDSYNYTLTQPVTTGNITGIILTVTGVTANSKVYDGTTAATLNTGSADLTGVLAGNNVTLVSTGATGTFVTKNVGTTKSVITSGFTLSGADAGNYTLTQPVITSNITTKELTIGGSFTANNKVYDGTTAATILTNNLTLPGKAASDDVTLTAVAVFASNDVGPGKIVSLTGSSLAGTDASNYTLSLTGSPTTTATITLSGLTVAGVTANNKVYDGTVAVTLNTGGAHLVGLVPGDVVTLETTGTVGNFDNKNVGSGKLVGISGLNISGPDAGKYTLIQPTSTASITSTGLLITGVFANNKIYDGTTSATLDTGGATLIGVLGTDNVSLVSTGATGTFANKNVGTNKSVSTSGFTLTGADAGNYTLTRPTTSADITPLALTISGVVTNNKVYNGTTSATLNTGSGTLSGVLPGDNVTLVFSGATGTFVNKNTGTAKLVTISGITLGGSSAGNYYIITQPLSSADITPLALTVSGVTASNKVYDGTTAVTLNTGGALLVGVVPGDVVTLDPTYAAGIFANKNAGTAKSVTVSGITIEGAGVANYTIIQPTISANITPLALTVSGVTANDKVYNGTTSATLNTGGSILSGVLPGDIVSTVFTDATGTFVNKNVGTGKSVAISGITLGGSGAGNYTLTQPSSVADITTSGLTISGVTVYNKVYDGTYTATLNTGSAVLTGVFGTDAVVLIVTGATGTFASANVGTAIVVRTSGFALGGTDSNNYTLTQPATTGNITGIILTVTGVTANGKVYDGTTAATLNTGGADLAGVLAWNNVTLVSTGATGTFANKNVGTTKSVTTSGFTLFGADAGKYILTQPTTSANITPLSATVSGVTANNKIYDGTTVATLNTGSAAPVGVLPEDIVNLVFTGATGNFVNKNSEMAKRVIISGITLGGSGAGNYLLTQPSSVANITTAGLIISGVTANNKVYDGTTTATLNTGSATLTGVFSSDDVSIVTTNATGTFLDKNTGVGKQLSVSGFSIQGVDATNYTLTQPSLYANITTKTLTITANNLTKAYRTTLIFKGTEFATNGLIAGDIVNSVTLNSPGALASAGAGSYVISISSGSDSNYNILYVNGILTVVKGILVAKADDKSKVYGSANPSLSITYSGFVNNEDISVIDSPPVASVAALDTSDAGTYPIILSGGMDSDYYITLINGSLEILKVPLTITAEDKIKSYGSPNPDFTITYSGFVSGQDQSILDAQPLAETDADVDSDAGIYDINLTGAVANNYDIIYNKGTLTINKADQNITFDSIPATIRMTQEYQLIATASSGLQVTFESSDWNKGSLTGNILTAHQDGNIVITALQGGDQNWNPARDVSQSIEILPTFDNISSLFTPNADGMNDYWYISDLEQYGRLQVTVYNRFGQVVYKSDSYKNDWNGTWNGYPLPSAAYYYIIKSSEKGFIKGVVNIVR